MALSDLHRPKRFEAVVGQDATVRWLVDQVGKKQPRSVVIHGPTGTGKTSLGRIYAAALLCLNRCPSGSPCGQCDACQDCADGNPANFIARNCSSLDPAAVDDLIKISRAYPLGAEHRIFMFDEAHRLSRKSFDMLLTVLETPRQNIFMFLTTEIDKIPHTVFNRCSGHGLALLDIPTSIAHLTRVCAIEMIKAEPDALSLIATLGGGHVRDLLQYLEDAIEHGAVTAVGVRRRFNLDHADRVADYLRAVLDGNAAHALALIEDWQDHPARKRELIHTAIVDLFRRDVLRLRS